MKACPNCGEANSDGARFCQACATPLPEAPEALREERKVVTVLFCDLVGFTARSDQADPEEVRARLRPYHARLRTEIEGFGGTVEKFIGDAVMAVFGAPVAHEDDAERAVRSALRVIEAIEDLDEEDPELGLQVRVGINTGEAVVSLGSRLERGEGIVTGDVVNTASRLQGAAPVGTVVVGEQTYRSTEAVFDYEELRRVEVKGKAKPVPLWRAVAARARFGADVIRSHATALVGRQADLTILTGAFEKAVQEASVQLVTIVGEPGVGKSRLVAELASYVDAKTDLIRWRQGRCLPYGEGITFWALGEIVKAEAGILESDSPQTAAAKMEAVVPEDPDRDWLLQRLLPVIGLEASASAEREESFTAWRRFLESLADQRPSVFVFEDLHWAEETMLVFLEHVADWSEGVPMLLVATARPELYERRPAWAGGKRNATTIYLSSLTEAETARLVALLLEATVLPAEVLSPILERAGGNPLYAEEFVRLLKDRGLLKRRGGTFILAKDADVPFPETIHALIAARLDTLSPERKGIVQDAAVIGKVFWAGAVAAVGQREPKAVRDSLHDLSREELVRPARVSTIEGEAEFSFWHVLVRDVAYAQIPRAQRAEKHRRAASWVEGMAGDRVGDHAEILAHHYTEAHDLARAAGQTNEADELQGAALRFLILAGERALGLDTAKAVANLTRALELAPPGGRERAQVLARWADAVRQTGRYAEAGRALEEAIAEFKEHDDVVGAAGAMTTLANVLWYEGDRRSRELVAEAVALLESEAPGPELVAAWAEKARLESLAGESREATESVKRSLALAASLGLEDPAKALGYRGVVRCALGDAGGLDDLRRALALALERGPGREAAVLYNNLATSLWPIDGPGASLGVARQGIDFSERRGIIELAAGMASSTLEWLVDLGSWDEVLEAAASLAQRPEADLTDLITVRYSQAYVWIMRGRFAEAQPLAEWAVNAAHELEDPEFIPGPYGAAAMVRLAAGDQEGATGLLVELERSPYVRATADYAASLPRMIRTAVAAADVALAGRLASGIEPKYPYQEHAQCAAGATLAETRGATEEAAGLYAEAAVRWEQFGVIPEKAFALLGQGRCLVEVALPDEAISPLREAREIWASLGATPALDETDVLLARATSLSS